MLLLFAEERQKNKKDIELFMPSIGAIPNVKKRKTVLEQLESQVYTDERCLEIIKRRDKNSKDSYVQRMSREVDRNVSKIKERKGIVDVPAAQGRRNGKGGRVKRSAKR